MPVTVVARLKIKNNAAEPIIEANDALGGLHIAADNTARDAIPAYVKITGTLCWVTSTSSLYQWTGSTWSEVTLGGAAPPDAHYVDATTSSLTSGNFCYFSANDVASKTDAAAVASATCAGAYDGTSGKVRVLGVMEAALFSTTSPTPNIGEQVYLCRADAEGGNGAAGKVTTSPPTSGFIAPVGIIKSVDSGTFPTTHTAKVLLQVKNLMGRT
jgi:hypothetical protein